jgi:hypothetical protein
MATKELLMEPTLAGEHGDLHDLRLDLLRRAVEIYLELAYASGVVPEVVRRRLKWREDCAADELMSGPPFECAGKAPGRQTSIYALRLGNARYPHMKLQIQPWPNDAGFMLSVNTHDQVSGVDLNEAWDEAGLPTFLRYLRDYIESRRDECSDSRPDDRSEEGPSTPDASPRS